MSISRRTFLGQGGKAAAAMILQRTARRQPMPLVKPVLDPATLAKFVDPLPIPPVARPLEFRPDPSDSAHKVPYYRLSMRALEARVHRDLKATQLWGINSSSPGPTLETRSGKGMFVDWANELPARHFLPIDHTLHGAEANKPEVRTVVHLHGAKVPADSDGYPESWYVPGKSSLYHYPNEQDAALLWYHDHALGINRLNVYAGLFGLCVIRDPLEESLNLPAGQYEIPVILCDRIFDQSGQLYYPIAVPPRSPWVPEVFGNTTLANGKIFPFLDADPRKYRLRVLNAANGRFFHLSLSNGQTFQQIGTDQGLLPAPVGLKQLTLAPAERADLIVDFSDRAGEKIVLTNDFTLPVMQFRIARSKPTDNSSLPSMLRPMHKIAESEVVKTRTLTVGEIDDMQQNPVTMLLNNAHWNMPVTENPPLNSVEIWNLLNVTDDSHPIHLHLVRFQILDRRRFDAFAYLNQGILRYRGDPVPPEPGEAGWKDTVRADPGMITRIIVRFEGYVGRYVWHCHILEHEDNEMMRPFDVIAAE